MSRAVIVQLVAFVVIGVVATVFGVRYVAGPQSFGGAIDVTVLASDAAGVDEGTSVTYRGVPIGNVTSVTVDPPDDAPAVSITVSLDPGSRIPRDATARVVRASALGIRALDVAADTEDGPYLRSGDEIAAPVADQPLPLGDMLSDVASLLGGVDPESVRALGQTASTALDGMGPTLRGIIRDSGRISGMLHEHAGTFASLAADGLPVLHALAEEADGFPGMVRAGRTVTGALVDHRDDLAALLDDAPPALRRVGDLLTAARPNISGLLVGADTVTEIIGDRDASLEAGLTSIPTALSQLSTVVHGDRADFVLVATQGPACYYDTPRRRVGDESPREPNLDLYCPPGKDLAQRGARAAPRPNELGLRNATRAGTPIGPRMAEDPWLIPTGIDLLRQFDQGE